ncbi:hypothetical protein ACJ2A9_21065 [Anaerobacillus sp. MEB173]
MSLSERIIHEIDQLRDNEKQKFLKKIKEKYFQLPKDAFVVGENYEFG